MKKFEKYTVLSGLGLVVTGLATLAIENGRVPGVDTHPTSKPAPIAAAKHGGHGQGLPELATVVANMQPSAAPSHENTALTDVGLILTSLGVLAVGVSIVPDKDPARQPQNPQPAITPAMLPTQPAGETIRVA